MARSASGTADSRLCSTLIGAVGRERDVFEADLREAGQAFETVRIDGRTGSNAFPRFSTAARTRATRRALSCRLPRRPACSPPFA